ncbi:MAG: hypothetical protein EHM33_02340 [Chloroflexi bacterium]|nr:MAG: hypothetical protein EHM33_02340 [Chloroflexota bacterium]
MSKHFRPLIAFFALTILILACALPQIPPVGQPTQSSGTAIPPASPDPNKVGTVVALTLTALVPGGSTATAPATGDPTTSLPRTFYYLAPDSAGLTQVFRIESDGTTRHQITSESVSVSDYDVSLVDGSVAYVANNQLLYSNADGSERRVLVDGDDVDPNNPFISTISSPVFSSDAQTLAYGYKGLQIYSFSADESELVIENQIDDVGGGLFVPRELYSPERYSPDGTKLLITLGYYEGASSAIYYPANGELVRLEGGEGALICCDDTEWSSDSTSFYAASPILGMFNSGLWKVDATTGAVTTLIQADAGGGNYNVADEAYLAPDGQLYFFFGTVSSPEGIIMRSPLQLVRSAPDGVTGRTVLSGEDFQLLNEALWSPDASFVIAAFAPTQEVYQGGQAEIIYLDGRPNVVLTPFAQQMKWGP